MKKLSQKFSKTDEVNAKNNPKAGLTQVESHVEIGNAATKGTNFGQRLIR